MDIALFRNMAAGGRLIYLPDGPGKPERAVIVRFLETMTNTKGPASAERDTAKHFVRITYQEKPPWDTKMGFAVGVNLLVPYSYDLWRKLRQVAVERMKLCEELSLMCQGRPLRRPSSNVPAKLIVTSKPRYDLFLGDRLDVPGEAAKSDQAEIEDDPIPL